MGSSTLLQLVNQAQGELGITVTPSVVGLQQQDVVQLLALANASGYELMSVFPWRELTKPYRFTTQFLNTTGTWANNSLQLTNLADTTGVDTTYMAIGEGINQDVFVVSVDSPTQVTISNVTAQAAVGATVSFCKVKYALPADYQSIVPRTQWDKSKHWEMLGPEDPQQWEWLLSGYISTGPRIRWRLYGEYFQLWPPVTTPEYLGFEYRSKGWAASASGVVQNSFTADSDTCIYPDRLMVLAMKLKYFEAKGFDTTAMFRNYRENLNTAMAQNMSGANLSFAPRPGEILIGYDNIPDSNYGTQ